MKHVKTAEAVRLLLAYLLILCIPSNACAGLATDVVVNKSIVLDLQKKCERASIAAPDIAELVAISPTELQINGKKIGSTSLIIWDPAGKKSFFDIYVIGDLPRLGSQIQEVAPNDSIKAEYANDTLILSGKAARAETVAKVIQLAKAYAIRGDGAGESVSAVDGADDAAVGSLSPVAINNKDDGNGKGAKILNQIVIDEPEQVLLEVKVAQVDKNALKSLGISFFIRGTSAEGFSNQVGAPSGQLNINNSNGTSTSFTGIAGPNPGLASFQPLDQYQLGISMFKQGIGAVMKALVTKNLAQVLAEPNLLVKSGEVGKFLAGSKIPISVVSGVGAISGTTIQFIDVGVKLNFKPTVLENGLISLKIDPAEVSSISGTLAVNGYPIIDTREVRTKVQLRDGESLIMAGLLQEEKIKTMSKVPLLGDIPILGALFRSTEDDLKKKELVFFITPRLAKPNAPGESPALPTDKPLTPEQERELQWIPVPN